MAGYAIYIPNRFGGGDDHLASVGLEQLRALGDASPDASDVLAGGPDGGSGVLLAWRTGDPASDPPMTPEAFDWSPAKPDPERNLEAARFYIGIDPLRPVTPKDLVRQQQMAGEFVGLRDGNGWRVPQARFLPHTCDLNDEGVVERRVDARYETFWQRSRQHAAAFFEALDLADYAQHLPENQRPEAAEVTLSVEDGWRYCVDALAFNYRVNADIVSYLKLFDDTAIVAVVGVTISYPSILEMRDQKKTELPVSVPVG
jgi:hypothetical protein